MTILYLTDYDTKCYGVTFQKKDGLKYKNFRIFLIKKSYIQGQSNGNIFG